LSIIVILTAVIATIKAIRAGGGQDHEDPAVPSKVYAPAGLFPSAPEKKLLAEWNALPAEKRTEKAGHH
jgi:carbon starvation protein